MNDVITNPPAPLQEPASDDSPAGEAPAFDTSGLGAGHDGLHPGAPWPTALAPKRGRALALTWWTACALWAYFVFGELVVAAGYPEVLAATGVVAGFVAAGRRVKDSFNGAKATLVGGAITALLGSAFAIGGTAALSVLLRRRSIALVALLLAVSVAFIALWMVRRREREQPRQPNSSYPVAHVIAWLIVLVFTMVAVVLAAQD